MDCFPVKHFGRERRASGPAVSSAPPTDLTKQGHWYGGGESKPGAWPLESGKVQLSAFVTGDEVSFQPLGNFILQVNSKIGTTLAI